MSTLFLLIARWHYAPVFSRRRSFSNVSGLEFPDAARSSIENKIETRKEIGGEKNEFFWGRRILSASSLDEKSPWPDADRPRTCPIAMLSWGSSSPHVPVWIPSSESDVYPSPFPRSSGSASWVICARRGSFLREFRDHNRPIHLKTKQKSDEEEERLHGDELMRTEKTIWLYGKK